MGEPNNALAVYMNRPDRIRDLLEYYLGEKLPEDWSCEEMRGFYTVRNSKGKLSYRQRDFMAKVCLWGVHFRLGLENQDSVNLTYPWRVMELDCLAYGKAMEEIQERNRLCNESYGASDDFKYHYKKDDRIEPILNLTLYWGTGKWKKPLCLRDMMEDMTALPGKLRNLAGEYRVHLISMRDISEEDLQTMDSDLKYVLGIMRRTGSKRRYEKYISDNKNFFTKIPKSAVDVIDACTSIKDIREALNYTLNPETGEEEADMCKALAEIKKDALKRGLRQGMEKGLEQGMEKGLEAGTQRMNKLIHSLLAEGRQEDLLRSATDSLFQQKLFREYHI